MRQKQSFLKQIAASSNKVKTAWNIIKNNSGNPHYNDTINKINCENRLLKDSIEIADAFNEYYISTTTNLNIKHSNIGKASKLLNNFKLKNAVHMKTIPVIEAEIISVI